MLPTKRTLHCQRLPTSSFRITRKTYPRNFLLQKSNFTYKHHIKKSFLGAVISSKSEILLTNITSKKRFLRVVIYSKSQILLTDITSKNIFFSKTSFRVHAKNTFLEGALTSLRKIPSKASTFSGFASNLLLMTITAARLHI